MPPEVARAERFSPRFLAVVAAILLALMVAPMYALTGWGWPALFACAFWFPLLWGLLFLADLVLTAVLNTLAPVLAALLRCWPGDS